jgi:hypothetical protein
MKHPGGAVGRAGRGRRPRPVQGRRFGKPDHSLGQPEICRVATLKRLEVHAPRRLQPRVLWTRDVGHHARTVAPRSLRVREVMVPRRPHKQLPAKLAYSRYVLSRSPSECAEHRERNIATASRQRLGLPSRSKRRQGRAVGRHRSVRRIQTNGRGTAPRGLTLHCAAVRWGFGARLSPPRLEADEHCARFLSSDISARGSRHRHARLPLS